MPRTERARRPPEAENRAHIPRAIASREAMLWQGCSLSPRELERKAPRSVWATELPASRPIRWIVRESREANRTDSPAFGRPTPIQPFPNPDMDRINRHATTSQPSLVSNPRATRFRHSHPKSVILQPQPLLQPQPTAAKQTCPQQAAKVPRFDSSCNSAMLKMIEILFSNHRKIIFV